MDNSEKEILESLKNFDTKNLITKESFVELFLQGSYYLAYVINQKQTDQFEIFINPNKFGDAPINMLNYFGENILSKDVYIRRSILNVNLENFKGSPRNIKLMLNKKLNSFNIRLDQNKKLQNQPKKSKNYNSEKEFFIEDKTGKKINITGYKLYQFLVGDLLDVLSIIENKLETRNIDDEHADLFSMVLQIIKYIIQESKNNLNKYKNVYYNRKLLISSQIHAILLSLEPILFKLSFITRYNYGNVGEIEKLFEKISSSVYEIILTIDDKTLIPWPCMQTIMEFILEDGARKRVKEFKKQEVFQKFMKILENLSEIEIKNIRKSSDMREICKSIIDDLYGPTYETLVNKSYYSFLLSCLKSQNLENKMNALNDISDIINNLRNDTTRHKLFREFITQNKILEIIFLEGIHDEIIKRCSNLFVYFAQNNLLEDKFIEKIIERQDNKLMKKLLNKIISVFPKEKKDILFQRLSKGIKFNSKKNDDIEFISDLTLACLNKPTEKTPKDNKNVVININNGKNQENNFYGLNIIFDYIIKDFDDKIKYEDNNVDFAIESFKNTIFNIIRLNQLKIEEIFIFIEKLLDNIKNNKKHNSVVQSMKLLQYLMDLVKMKKISLLISNLKELDQKYNIILLLIDDLIRYISLLPPDFSEEKIYEGIYPHSINIEQRLKLIFYFFKKSSNNYGLDLTEKKYIEKIYKIFSSENFKKDLNKFYEIFTNNINEINDKILLDFFEYILKDKSELDIKNIKDKESINFIIKIFTTVNLNKKSIYHDGRKIRVDGGVSIDGFEMLFDLLTQNGNDEVQNRISELLCTLCLSFKDYSK